MPSPTQCAREVFDQASNPSSLRPLTASDQSRLARWEKEQFKEQPFYRSVLGVIEEVGELAHALLKHEQNIRGMGPKQVALEKMGDAIADATIFLMQCATKLRLDFATLVGHTISDVTLRNWNSSTPTVPQKPK